MYSSKCIVCDTELSLQSNTIDGQDGHKIWDTFCAFFHPSSPITNDIVFLSFCPTCSLNLANLQLLLRQLKSIESRMFKIIACMSSKIIENCEDRNSDFEAQQIKLELQEFAVNELSTDNSNHRIDKQFNAPIDKNIVAQIRSIRTEVWNSFTPQLKLSNCQEPTSQVNVRKNRKHLIIHHWPKNTPQSEETDEVTEKDPMDDGEENETPIDDDDYTPTLDDSIESESDEDKTDDEEEKKEKQRKYWRDKKRRLALGIKKKANHLAITRDDGTFAYNEWTYEQTEGGRFKCHTCSSECGTKKVMNRHIKKQHIIASDIGRTGKKIVRKLRLLDLGDGKFTYGGTWGFTAHPINGFECSTCKKYSRSKDGIMRHIKLAHRPDEGTEKDMMHDGQENETPMDDSIMAESESDDVESDDEEEKKEKLRKYWRDKKRRLALGIKLRVARLAITRDDGTFAYNEWTYEQTEGGRFKCHACSSESRTKHDMNKHIKKKHINARTASDIGRTGKKIVKKLRPLRTSDANERTEKDAMDDGEENKTPIDDDDYSPTLDDSIESEIDDDKTDDEEEKKEKLRKYWRDKKKRLALGIKLRVARLAITRDDGTFAYNEWTYEQTEGGRFKCRTCGAECGTKHGMNKHIKKQHIIVSDIGRTGKKIVRKLRLVDLGDGKFTYGGTWGFTAHPINGFECSTCNKYNRSKDGIMRHIKLSHCPGSHTCEHCGKRYTSDFSLEKHRCEVPRSNNGRLLHCGEGKFIYFTGGDLIKKFEFEKIGDKFKCSVCGHTMGRKDTMCQHIKLRHADKKVWMCETCGKSFCRQRDFKDHLSVHSDDRPHLCSTCGKTFKTEHDIRKHLRLNHQTLEYKCEYCGRLCKTRVGLLQHQQSRHIPKDNNHTAAV